MQRRLLSAMTMKEVEQGRILATKENALKSEGGGEDLEPKRDTTRTVWGPGRNAPLNAPTHVPRMSRRRLGNVLAYLLNP